MHLKYTILFMSGLTLCLMIISAGAETAGDDRQAVRADQQALDDAYKQLQKDRREGNAAGIQIDQNNIDAAEQDFRTDEQRSLADDQKTVAADREALDRISQQLLQDQQTNAGALEADETAVKAAQQKLQADKQQMVADDGLEVTRDQQALDNENQQLQTDLKQNVYAVGGADIVQSDEANIKEATTILQHAQMKFQIDTNDQNLPR